MNDQGKLVLSNNTETINARIKPRRGNYAVDLVSTVTITSLKPPQVKQNTWFPASEFN